MKLFGVCHLKAFLNSHWTVPLFLLLPKIYHIMNGFSIDKMQNVENIFLWKSKEIGAFGEITSLQTK